MNRFAEVKEKWKFVFAKPLSQIARDYENWWAMGREFGFGKIFGGETKLCVLNLLISTELFM